ncbi:hypothetical protein HGRIS_007462 [Hohenbuehelia grisea]
MGVPFAEHLVEFARQKGISTSEVAKISMNPEQSKHLETATFRVLDRMLDVVNLRSEEYAGDSRIPNQVAFGTPLQDALRRDITINALFYNIHTRTVEDFTEKGLDDLRSGIVRTPLAPTETFHDDPLRVVRCIRFASRFGFDMVPELEAAARDPITHEALKSKVSRERIGEEITKMMKGGDPLSAMRHIHNLNLYSSIFAALPREITSSFSDVLGPSTDALKASTILLALLEPPTSMALCPVHPTLLSTLSTDPTSRPRLFLAAALTPYRGVTYQDRKKKTIPAVDAAIRESLKLGAQNHFLDGIPALFAASGMLVSSALDDARFTGPSERVAIGLLLREKVVHNANTGSHWTSSLLFSLVQELVPLYDADADVLDIDAATEIISVFNTFVERIHELALPDAVDARPLLDVSFLSFIVVTCTDQNFLPNQNNVICRAGKGSQQGTQYEPGRMDGTRASAHRRVAARASRQVEG